MELSSAKYLNKNSVVEYRSLKSLENMESGRGVERLVSNLTVS